MFDAETAQLLRLAPGVPGLDPDSIPALLTRHYATLVSSRLRGTPAAPESEASEWPLERIADTYELMTSIQTDTVQRRAAAFVAGTAQQILARREAVSETEQEVLPNIDEVRVDPTLAAALLFLAAEQYADASEAADAIRVRQEGQLYEATILAEGIVDLARGRLMQIVERGRRWRRHSTARSLEEQALSALLETLITGLELLAADFLDIPAPEVVASRFNGAQDAFLRVFHLSTKSDREHAAIFGSRLDFSYAGAHHLSSLLLAALDGIGNAALTKLPPPDGADTAFWKRWLFDRAGRCPFVWPNHRKAIAEEFYQTGNSAVIVLPTGAGKTTVSSLKIAGTLARGKKVIFLAPTHALVEQLVNDLQDMFPRDVLGAEVSNDFDLLFDSESQLREIEVMTPERCLAMLSFAREAFSEVGLLVFDECHLLSPDSGKERRAIDGMLCLLSFNHVVPDADLLFLSAMVKNGREFGEWIRQLTKKTCVSVDLLWKPSRQARGVLVYNSKELDEAVESAWAVQQEEDIKSGKKAKDIRARAVRKLVAQPWAIWGLQHNWLDGNKTSCVKRIIQEQPVYLNGKKEGNKIKLKPNVNNVAGQIAISAARQGLKTIIFVNTKNDAVLVAKRVSEEISEEIIPTDAEKERWNALEDELGGLKYSLLNGISGAVPHNSLLLQLERDLAERMFRRANGAKIIVATPTLAQGLNLPAHFAIIAGDKRASSGKKGREDLKAHEILNAAARAGRAGHLANGVVLLIPEPIIEFSDGKKLNKHVIAKLKSILPEDDRCVVINDPLEIVLDRLMQGDFHHPDVRYIVNRMAALGHADSDEDPSVLFDLEKSYAAFTAKRKMQENEFKEKIKFLRVAIANEAHESFDRSIAVLATQSGLSMQLLMDLKKRVSDNIGNLPTTVRDWLIWTVEWLKTDDSAREVLLSDVRRSVLGACGLNKDGELTGDCLVLILPGLIGWIEGKPLSSIERDLGGNPDSEANIARACHRARELVGSIIPRGLSFVMGLISHVVNEIYPFDNQDNLDKSLVEFLSVAVRRGFDSQEKVIFASKHPEILSRVQVHQAYGESPQEIH